jgi:hypothetical protein
MSILFYLYAEKTRKYRKEMIPVAEEQFDDLPLDEQESRYGPSGETLYFQTKYTEDEAGEEMPIRLNAARHEVNFSNTNAAVLFKLMDITPAEYGSMTPADLLERVKRAEGLLSHSVGFERPALDTGFDWTGMGNGPGMGQGIRVIDEGLDSDAILRKLESLRKLCQHGIQLMVESMQRGEPMMIKVHWS